MKKILIMLIGALIISTNILADAPEMTEKRAELITQMMLAEFGYHCIVDVTDFEGDGDKDFMIIYIDGPPIDGHIDEDVLPLIVVVTIALAKITEHISWSWDMAFISLDGDAGYASSAYGVNLCLRWMEDDHLDGWYCLSKMWIPIYF